MGPKLSQLSRPGSVCVEMYVTRANREYPTKKLGFWWDRPFPDLSQLSQQLFFHSPNNTPPLERGLQSATRGQVPMDECFILVN